MRFKVLKKMDRQINEGQINFNARCELVIMLR